MPSLSASSSASVESRASKPATTSKPSGRPSPSESELVGSVPSAISLAFDNPSPSKSASASPNTVNLLAMVGNGSELPAVLVAISTKSPTASGNTSTSIMADLPSGPTIDESITNTGGENSGTKE